MIDLAAIANLLAGAITVVGLMQWGKGLWKGLPKWVQGSAVPILALLYSIAPSWAREASGIVAVSQLGYETLFQPIIGALKWKRPEEA